MLMISFGVLLSMQKLDIVGDMKSCAHKSHIVVSAKVNCWNK